MCKNRHKENKQFVVDIYVGSKYLFSCKLKQLNIVLLLDVLLLLLNSKQYT